MAQLDAGLLAKLDAYWTGKQEVTYTQAAEAMKGLAARAAVDPEARHAFANMALFERALMHDANVNTEKLLWSMYFQSVLAEKPGRSARQVMLDMIHETAIGPWWWPEPDPSGVTSWIKSDLVAGPAIVSTLKLDPVADVVAAALRVLRDAAIPASWLELLISTQAFETLDSRLATTRWSRDVEEDLATRRALQALSAAARGRVQTDLARLALAVPEAAFLSGDGSTVPTTPPPRRPWYKRAELYGAAMMGLAIGGAVAARR